MLGEVGTILVGFSLFVTLYAGVAAVLGIARRRTGAQQRIGSRWLESAQHATYAAAALLGLALLLLLIAFLSNDFSIRYVAQHTSTFIPVYLKVSAIWAGQEGSLLLWSFLQALFAALATAYPSKKARPLVPWAMVFLNIITAFFVAVTVFLSNPFIMLPEPPANGQGLNPLLRHPGMIFHPPALYVGYVGLAVPFAFAMAALIARKIKGWTAAVRTWTLIAWLGLGLGLLLGMRWAYDVLGWGGYWGWDPVENAGLLPWLTATALLHSAVMQEEKRGFRLWNIALVTTSFVLVLFGTFATRSGMIQSVHAYARSNLGGYFLTAIGVTLIGTTGLIVARRKALANTTPLDNLLSRDGMFFLTLTLLSTLTLSVLVGSLLPTITERLGGQRFEAGPAWFDRVTGPQFALLILVMGVCPLLGRAAAALKRLRRRLWAPLAGTLVVPAGFALAGFNQAIPLVGFGLVGLAAATTGAEFVTGAVRRHRQTGEPILNAAWTLLRIQRRRYGGYLVHIGVILMAVGVIGTRMYPFERELTLVVQEPVQVGAYTLTYEELRQDMREDHLSVSALVAVDHSDNYLATLEPRLNRFSNSDQSITVPAVKPGVREDLYVILSGWSDNGNAVTLKVVVNALVNFLWLGGLLFMAGGALALWPRMKSKAWNAVALVAGAALLVGAGWSMWGLPHGIVQSGAGRPAVGETAPDFRLRLTDGGTFRLEEHRGEVVVVNFWGSWCPPCQDEMPDLQAAWEAYREQGVQFVGVTYQDELANVQEALDEFGTTYPVGLDRGDEIASLYGITGVPETFVVDQVGRVAFVHIGPVTEQRLTSNLDQLVAAP